MINLVKISIIGIFIIFCFFSCSIHQKKSYANSCVIDVINDEFIFTKQDSIKLDKIYASNKKFADSCEKYNLNCIFDPIMIEANFKGGIHKFYKVFSDNFEIPKKTIHGTKSTAFLTIGRNGEIKSFKILDTKKNKLHNEISRVLRLEELNNWKPAYIVGDPCEYSFEIKFIFIEK
ncbi:hypothetical protein FLJC2902T_32220 [Flavobacterium limnosediminis JC2902]|uniref:TonB C-terminal domain-containing protein n=1 Tax=Flavobacterium limnosediminis JC2902 TaxID=1341181 RepID=V6SBH9_9FLAO|nr:hypothetical protein [Flavobacterium limnosediminis]ESU23809.1 hypothetical protein FLJC2902T_32220 [Flavobacterium limnosediminis JC2902]